jgi:hypothetical protein
MTTNGESKFSYLFIGLCMGLGAIGGLMFGLLARKETRESLRESSSNTLDYLNQPGKKLREITEGVVEKGKEIVGHCCGSVDAKTGDENHAYQAERRDHLGG